MSLANGELREKNGQHFVLHVRAKCLQNLREKNGQHSVLFLHKNYPKDLHSRLGYLSAFGPSSGLCLRSMGPSTLLFCPSPASLRDLQGMGHVEVEVKSTLDLSSRDGREETKSKTGFELARRQSHLRDSTVAPPGHFPFRPALCRSAEGSGEV